ncbi:MAG: GFA family protein [Opitutaceae bacterium]
MSTPANSIDAHALKGMCYCGAVQFEVADAFSYSLNCHCSDCRRTTGSAFKPFAGILRQELSVTKGQDRLLIYGKEAAHDVHCAVCGSLLYSVVREEKYVHVPLGALVDEPSIRPTAHIWVSDKAPWFTITDNLPQHAESG